MSLTSFSPSQNEPKASQGVPSSVMMRFGSIAFQLVTPGTDWITLPWSSQWKRGSRGSSVTLVATPMHEVFLPKAEME